MADMTPAPPCATGQASPETVARWPAPEEWPADDAPTLAWARFYVARLRLRVLPTPSPQDRTAYAIYLSDQARETYREDHGAEPPEEVASQFWDDAREMAANLRGPIPRIAHGWGDRPVTDANLVAWFSPAPGSGLAARKSQHHLERGVCCVLGDRDGVAQVDVDPRHGGDLAGPWANLPGPRVDTPRGGRHVFVDLSTMLRGERVHGSSCVVAPGVDIRSSGTAVLPSGASSPGRAWALRDAPRPPPMALLRAPPRPASRIATSNPTTPWDGHAGVGRVAAILASDIGRGDGRTKAAQAIVGILAAPRAVPDDVLDAALAMLVEYGAGRDWPAARVNEECLAWRAALTRGPRDAEFAEQVVATWVATRDVGPAKKSATWARSTARSTWKTADRRQEGNAGAEDVGLAALVGLRDAEPEERAPPSHGFDDLEAPDASAPTTPAPVRLTPSHPDVVAVAVETLRQEVLHGRACTCAACLAERTGDRDAFLRRILPFSADAYPDEAADRDMERTPLRVEKLYPWWDFWSVKQEVHDPDLDGPEVGHGYGRQLARAIGGLLPGDYKVFGGAGAKIGKTHLIGQMLEGLAMCAAARLLGVPGYEDAPLVMLVWVTEMPKPGEVKYRMISRHFGFDMAALMMAGGAAEAPGILHMAEKAGCSPDLVVRHARAITRAYRSDDTDVVGFVLRHMVVELAMSEFPAPKGTGRSYVDEASGVNLIGHLADAITLRRREFAARCGVPEDQVIPLVAIDPGQRFIGSGDSAKKELDAFLSAALNRLCRTYGGIGSVLVMTSDTTKAAVKEIDLDVFMSEPGPRLAADIFAGSQAMAHVPDTVIAVCGQDGAIPYRRTQWVRVLQGRTGATQEAYPFAWETHIGRFRPGAAQPLRAAADGPGRGRSGGDRFSGRGVGRRTGDNGAPPGDQPSPHAGYFSNYVPRRHGPDAD